MSDSYAVTEQHVILIPHWLEHAFSQPNVLTHEWFNRYLSKSDQINLFTAQSLSTAVFGMSVDNSEFQQHLATTYLISRLTDGLVDEFEKESLMGLSSVSMTEQHVTELNERLLATVDSAASVVEKPTDLRVLDIDRGVIGVVVPEGVITYNLADRIRATESLLSALFKTTPQAVVQATVWYRIYVDLIAKSVTE